MQVFIVGSPLETAQILDRRRLNRQIQEAKVILDALNGAKAWSNHPCVLQYRGYEGWLNSYMFTLKRFKAREMTSAHFWNTRAEKRRPPFHTEKYFDQMKRRLYSKDPIFYAQWMNLGLSECNWYYVDDEWIYYKNGKRVNEKI